MGVNFKDITVREPIRLTDLSGKTLAIDAYNMLYQFLSTIRAPNGSYFTDSHGEVTSHLIGLFNRVTALLSKKVKLVFVFDGIPPVLKTAEIARRRAIKDSAKVAYEEAAALEGTEGMKKYAIRTTSLTEKMIVDAKELLLAMGIPCVDAPSEAEAQCAFMVEKGIAWAAASQDYDALLFGAPRVIQNLSVAGRKGKDSHPVTPQLIVLDTMLLKLGIGREKLIWLAMLIGTDYNGSGVKGIGPKKGLNLVKHFTKAEDLFSAVQWTCDASWQEVLRTFTAMPVQDVHPVFGRLDSAAVLRFLVEKHDFSRDRVNETLSSLRVQPSSQRALGDFT